MELAGKGADMSESVSPRPKDEEEVDKSNKEGEGGRKEEQVEESVEGESPSSQAASSFPSITSSRSKTSLRQNLKKTPPPLSTGFTVQTQ